jgi:hypothetical protein
MPLAGFEPTISAGERPQTHVLDRTATETDKVVILALSNGPICERFLLSPVPLEDGD